MIEMTLPTMTCDHCVRAVTRGVKQVDPTATVEIDLALHRLRIESSRDVGVFRSALAAQGYEEPMAPSA
jgi:copper chaperone